MSEYMVVSSILQYRTLIYNCIFLSMIQAWPTFEYRPYRDVIGMFSLHRFECQSKRHSYCKPKCAADAVMHTWWRVVIGLMWFGCIRIRQNANVATMNHLIYIFAVYYYYTMCACQRYRSTTTLRHQNWSGYVKFLSLVKKFIVLLKTKKIGKRMYDLWCDIYDLILFKRIKSNWSRKYEHANKLFLRIHKLKMKSYAAL